MTHATFQQRAPTQSHADLAALAAAASPAPWTYRAEVGTPSFAVESGETIVERDLPEPFARYLVTLRSTAAAVLGTAPSRRAKADLRSTLAAAMRDVGAQWVFVAPATEGRYYLHDCLRRIGAARLRRADALFLDAAKLLLPALVGAVSRGRTDGVAKRIVIPKRDAVADVSAEYGGFADRDLPLHALSGRNELPERTEAMIAAILRHVDVPPGARILDIGCGDGTLLRRLAPGAARLVGTVLTKAEREKLAPALAGIAVATASFETIDRIVGPFDRIVANGCMHFVRTAAGADRAVAKLGRLLAPGGRIWAGELHATDCRQVTFSSKIDALRHVRARHGRPFALAFARHIWRHRRRAGLIVERPPTDWWHVRPDAMGALAARHGLAVAGTWSCFDLTGDTFYRLQDRFSCLLVKP